jgi:hypothetical protein
MRVLAPILALVLAAAASSIRAAPSVTPVRVGCDQIIDQERSKPRDYRLVLRIVAVPPARLAQRAVRVSGRWPYWHKAGLVIHSSRKAVTVTVPKAWRGRVAITWGNDTGVVSSLRLAPCPSPPHLWNAYAGGFYVRSAKACVPLVFRVVGRQKLVRFGIGRSC